MRGGRVDTSACVTAFPVALSTNCFCGLSGVLFLCLPGTVVDILAGLLVFTIIVTLSPPFAATLYT